MLSRVSAFSPPWSPFCPTDARSALRDIGKLAQERGVRAHVVGGFVRDMLLSHPNLDIDVVIEGDAVEFAEAAAESMGARVKVHRRFGTAILVLSHTLHVDVTSARTEYYTRPGALPTVERSSLRQDLLRRDFSVNAMAACINPDLLRCHRRSLRRTARPRARQSTRSRTHCRSSRTRRACSGARASSPGMTSPWTPPLRNSLAGPSR